MTASYDFMTQVEALDEVAQMGGSTAVLSVGIAPGLTNLLARYAQSRFDQLEHLDIHLLLGLGEKHGEAAVRWMVENMNADFTVMENGMKKPVRSFADGVQTRFPGKLGRRTTYRFDFSDQHVLPRTLTIPSVSMRIAFDSALITNFMAIAKKLGLFGLLRYRWAQDALVKLLMRLQFGSELFVAQVDGHGVVSGKQKSGSFAVVGEREARFTGLVAAQVAEGLMTAVYSSGVFHIEQLFEPLLFIEALAIYGLEFRHMRVSEKVLT
ncbi:MAG: saccharopine dehydrogenase family protein [Anaerolineae bacterium]